MITVSFFFIWLAIAAVASSIVEYEGGPLWLQILIFALVSTGLIMATRPFAKRIRENNAGLVKSTKESMLGKRAIVTKEIDNSKNTGEVKLDGVFWKAKSDDDNEVLSIGSDAYVARMDGIKIVVSKTTNIINK